MKALKLKSKYRGSEEMKETLNHRSCRALLVLQISEANTDLGDDNVKFLMKKSDCHESTCINIESKDQES